MTESGAGNIHMRRDGPFSLTVVVPCFDEEAVIVETHRRLRATVDAIPGVSAELLFVDDGSRDHTLQLLRQIAARDAAVRVVSLSRNFGHQLALSAGLEHATGDVVAIIDADLQDPPELIAEFVAKWREGHDVIYGVRRHRHGESGFKLTTAHLFYRLMRWMSDTEIPYDAGDFRLLDRSARLAGETKYPLRKMIRFALDGIFSFSAQPLRLATYFGFFASGLAVVGVIYAFVLRLANDSVVPGWATLLIAVLFLGGVQLVSLGIMGEYIARIYGQVKQRPLYLVRERVGFDSDRRTED